LRTAERRNAPAGQPRNRARVAVFGDAFGTAQLLECLPAGVIA
jgi:hypothetical protein